MKISLEDWRNLENCKCGGPLFKFQNTSKNVFVVKCGYVKENFEIEPITKKWIWVPCKKQPCKFLEEFHGTLPVFEEKIEIIKKINTINPHQTLYDTLDRLFRFVLIEPKKGVLQEIDLLVKYKLRRIPRRIYYFPTAGPFMEISHKETLQDYRKRIFSREIVDFSIPKKINTNNFIEEDLSELEESDIETDHEVSDDDEQEEEEEPESELPVDSDREGSEVYDDYEDNDDFCDYND
jgi:hypothetical protein